MKTTNINSKGGTYMNFTDIKHMTIVRILCPYCGKWHKSPETWRRIIPELAQTKYNVASFGCPHMEFNPIESDDLVKWWRPIYNFRIKPVDPYDDSIYYYVKNMCDFLPEIHGSINCSSLITDPEIPILTFDVSVGLKHNIRKKCLDCKYKEICNFAKLSPKGNQRHITIKLGFEFDIEDYNSIMENPILDYQGHELVEYKRFLIQIFLIMKENMPTELKGIDPSVFAQKMSQDERTLVFKKIFYDGSNIDDTVIKIHDVQKRK